MNHHNRQDAHRSIDHIFKDLLPARGMPWRSGQAALCHQMPDALLGNRIALCDAGTGIGKTYAYLAAGIVFRPFRPEEPILISTSSVALQKAMLNEYLPFLSAVLLEDGMIGQPLRAVIRKGKSHYVCDRRLEQRLGQLDLRKKNWKAGTALLALREMLDLDEVSRLSNYDRQRVCVPRVCDCGEEGCRYHAFLDACDRGNFLFQICNHNLLLADAIHRGSDRRPILPDTSAVILDEAHKLPETARQMFGTTLRAVDIQDLIRDLRREKYFLAADSLAETSRLLLRKLERPCHSDQRFSEYARLLTAPNRALLVIRKQVGYLLSPPVRKRLERMISTIELFEGSRPDLVSYLAEDLRGTTMLCATVSDLTAQLRSTLWNRPGPMILTSGTLSVGSDFHRFREETGLLENDRVTESISISPFDYRENCLLFISGLPAGQRDHIYYDKLADEITLLLEAAHGHALVLFTSYAAMSAVKERLTTKNLLWPLFTLGRNAVHITEQFKASPGSVLLATGAAWEGFDFPGDCVSLLIIPRLPFARPDALKEKVKEAFPDLRSFIRTIVVPEMQIKLKQGFGRAIRTETDTCVVAILDERSVPGQRYYQDVKNALPEMRITDNLQEVEAFIRSVKEAEYFQVISGKT